MAHDPQQFIGAWTLKDWRIEYPDGRTTRPFGDNPIGYIIYSACGVMTASIASQDRNAFGQANARNASDEQKAAAFDSYFHYAGPWRIEGETVIHDATIGLNPNMSGTEQRRNAVFSDGGGGLELSAEETTPDGDRRHILQWLRADA